MKLALSLQADQDGLQLRPTSILHLFVRRKEFGPGEILGVSFSAVLISQENSSCGCIFYAFGAKKEIELNSFGVCLFALQYTYIEYV